MKIRLIMKIKIIAPVFLVLFFQSALAQGKPSISDVDRIRLAEALPGLAKV